MSFPSSSIPVANATEAARLTFLRRTIAWTAGGVGIASLTGIASAFTLAFVPALSVGFVPTAIILGMWAITNFVAQPMVFGRAKLAGFLLGTAAQGVALGFLLLVAAVVSAASLGNPLVLIGLALGMTFFTGLGMTAYVYTVRRDFSLIGAGLSAVTIPMLILMAASFAVPSWFGGTFGIVLAGVFVLISAAALVYQLNKVIHDFRTDMHIEGAYTISIALLVLFWNILSLLLRLTRR